MGRQPAQDVTPEESGRDSRIKLILLVVALVLVAGYAASVTRMGDMVLKSITGLFSGGLPLLPIAGVVAAVAIAALAVLFLRRRRPAKAKSAPKEVGGQVPLARVSRSDFLKRIGAQVDSHAKSGRQLAVHLIDIDGFRTVNELLGEAEGDAFLRLVGERLLVLVNHPDRLARIGDDEFAVIQPEVGGARHAEIYVHRIEETLKDACAQVPRHARPSASIGVAVYPEHGADAEKLIHAASLALHAAKKAGGDGFMVFSREMEMEVEARLEMEKAISEGLHHGWFELHYQPQYDLITRRLTGFEALVRMRRPEHGLLLPASFLPVAEESGLIQPLGEWIIREALAAASNWPEHVTLAINISPAQLRHGDIAGAIINMLAKAGMDGSRLRVEVSESVLLDGSKAIADQLQRLKSRGVTIVLDDFGLETSRLKALSGLACDAVKIDRSLIENVGEEPETENLVRGLIGTAQAFDLGVLAEGVERAEQAHFLLSHDCRNVQGFLFGRPTPSEEIASIIAKDLRNASEGAGASAHSSRSAA